MSEENNKDITKNEPDHTGADDTHGAADESDIVNIIIDDLENMNGSKEKDSGKSVDDVKQKTWEKVSRDAEKKGKKDIREEADRKTGEEPETIVHDVKKKKLPTWAKALIIVGASLLVLCLAAFIGIKIYLSRVNRIKERDTVSRENEVFERSTEPGEDTIKAEEVKWEELYQSVKRDKDIKNIILIGQDRRPEDTEPARSDSIILCSINKKKNQITLISFMRDMYVPIEGYSDNRINAAYNFGGVPLLEKTLTNDFGITIDNAIEVDFEGFIQAMTAVGNLEIELTQDEADYLNEAAGAMNREAGLEERTWYLKAGKNSLSPDQALAYSRTRYVGRSDWDRTERQRKVLTAAFNKVSEMGVSEQLDLVNEVIPYFATDMTDMEILGYVYYIAKEGIHVGNTYRIPEDGCYTNERINGMDVLLPDLNKNVALLKEYLN